MAYDGKLLARARTELEGIRAANRAEQQRRLTEVYGRLPEVQEIDTRLRAHMARLVRLTIGHRDDLQQQISQLFFQIVSAAGFLQHVDSADNLHGFFNAGSLQTPVCLLSVPGASVFRPEPCNDGFKFIKSVHLSFLQSFLSFFQALQGMVDLNTDSAYCHELKKQRACSENITSR
jgi:hypothetical protein